MTDEILETATDPTPIMTHSEELTNIAAALVAVQVEIENPHKTSENPHYRSKYADLTEIINTVRPVLSSHGIAIVQSPGMQNGMASVETILLHISGEWIRGCASSPISKNDPQGVGSAITYLRRYSLAALLGLGQEDDDGNAASRTAAEEGKASDQSSRRSGKKGESTEPFTLDTICDFQKHKGKTWKKILEEEPQYVGWAIHDSKSLNDEAKEVLRKALEGREGKPEEASSPDLIDPQLKQEVSRTWNKLCKSVDIEDKNQKLNLFLGYVAYCIPDSFVLEIDQLSQKEGEQMLMILTKEADAVLMWLEKEKKKA